MHKRLFPRVNAFVYGIYYLSLPLAGLTALKTFKNLGFNSFKPLSFYTRDHGTRTHDHLEEWAHSIVKPMVPAANGHITLITLPRVLGYVFNPVSFWLCHDAQGTLRAVLCEVNNTFGETHTYLCAHPDGRVIGPQDILKGRKIFHVSPLLQREGYYEFRFDSRSSFFGAWIDFYDGSGQKQLITALSGTLTPMTDKSLRRAFWRYPLVTFKAIILIHWQAVKLLAKGIKYVPRPKQIQPKISSTEGLL